MTDDATESARESGTDAKVDTAVGAHVPAGDTPGKTGVDADPTGADLDPTPSAPQRFQWGVAALGALIAALGVSGIIDDAGWISHPWWTVLLIAGLLACVLVGTRTVRQLARASAPENPAKSPD